MADLSPNPLAVEIKSMLSDAQPFYPAKCCIHKVPLQIRNLNPDAYTPKVVSIGPFHYGGTILQKMEGHKQMYCEEFIKRSKVDQDELMTVVRQLEPEVRHCYSDEIELPKEKFFNVILVDSGFVLEFLWKNSQLTRSNAQDEYLDDAVMSTPWLRNRVILDLLLYENQLPFFVFQEIYKVAFPSHDPLFVNLDFRCLGLDFGCDANTGSNISHFTDLLRTSYLQLFDKNARRKGAKEFKLRSAIKLNEAGVKFMVIKANNEASNEASICLLDLDFSGCILKIPEIVVSDHTEIMLRNMMALEQCFYPRDSYIIDYVGVLDFLINTDKDVDFLVKKKIIVNWLGDNKEVAGLFNGLMKNIVQTNVYSKYSDICSNLEKFCDLPIHRGMATLRRDYCNTPWKTLASIVGIILVILTVVQAVCSILQAYPPSKVVGFLFAYLQRV